MRLKISLQRLAERFAEGSLMEAEINALRRDPRAGARAIYKKHHARLKADEAEAQRLRDMLQHEESWWGRGAEFIAGVDEVGAGPLAGPVVAAAVILKKGASIPRINDSKQLTAPVREELAALLREQAVAWALGSCTAQEIDTLNIYQARFEAIRRALRGLQVQPQHVLVDGVRIGRLGFNQTAIVKGDSLSQSIAAASIIAKVHRDGLMQNLDKQYPGYGFAGHVGYSTPVHMKALHELGPCPEHRRSFQPVAQAAAEHGMAQPAITHAPQSQRHDDDTRAEARAAEAFAASMGVHL